MVKKVLFFKPPIETMVQLIAKSKGLKTIDKIIDRYFKFTVVMQLPCLQVN